MPSRTLSLLTVAASLSYTGSSCLAGQAGASGSVPGETWDRYAEVSEAGFDAAKLEALRESWAAAPSSAFMIIRDGVVVASWGDVDRRYMCHSTRKSFLSGLIGVYHDAGKIDIEQTLAELDINDIEDGLTDSEREATIHDLLKARSGVYRLAAYEPPQNPKPPRHSYAAGTQWCYNNWDFNTLNTVFQQVTGDDTFEAFNEHLAGPIGMQDFRVSDGYYHLEPEKSEHPAYPFRMSARDMARYGVLFERGGDWEGKQLISEDWVDASRTSYSDFDENAPDGLSPFSGGYGYMWWVFSSNPILKGAGMYAALGVGNQVVAVLPAHDIVIVNRANTYDGERTPGPALEQFVLDTIAAVEGPVADDAELVPLEDDGIEFRTDGAMRLDLNQFVGGYTMPPAEFEAGRVRPYTLNVDNGRLLFVSETQGTFQWHPRPNGGFVAEDSLVEIAPWKNAAGEITGFIDSDSASALLAQATAAGDNATASLANECLATYYPDSADTVGTHAGILAANGAAGTAGVLIDEAMTARPHQDQQMEARINSTGYAYLNAQKTRAAVNVFELVAELWPMSFNAWDSLGEGLMNAGENDRAIEAYERSLELNPANANATSMIQQMRSGG